MDNKDLHMQPSEFTVDGWPALRSALVSEGR